MNNVPTGMPPLTPEAVAWLSLLVHNQAQPNATVTDQPPQDPLVLNQPSSSPTLFPANEHASVDDFPFNPPSSDPPEILCLQTKVDTLENEIAVLKRTIEEAHEKRISKKYKLAGSLEDIRGDQKVARDELARSIRYQLKSLTGRLEEGDERQDVMVPDFTRTAMESPNQEIIQRAADLVAEEFKSEIPGVKYDFEGQEFTIDDLRSFAKRTFNGWKAAYQAEKDEGKKKKKEDFQRKNRRYTRQVALSAKRSKAKNTYEKTYGCELPDAVFDPAYMTEYHSGLDTAEVSGCSDISDSEVGKETKKEMVGVAKDAHYFAMAKKANTSVKDQTLKAPVWEIRKKKFRSNKYNEMLAEFDEIVSSERKQKKRKGPVRILVPKVDLGNEDLSPPDGKNPVPSFMVDPAWLEAYRGEGNSLDMAATDPEDFD